MVRLRKFFTTPRLMLVFLLWVSCGVWMFIAKGGYRDLMELSNGTLIPDLFAIHSKEDLMKTFSDWGAQGRLYYLRYQYRDFIYPVIYSVLLSGILIRLIRPKTFNIWVIVPLLAILFDFGENYFLRVLVYNFPNLIPNNILFASIFSSLKWFIVSFSFILIYIAYNNRRKQYQLFVKRNNYLNSEKMDKVKSEIVGDK